MSHLRDSNPRHTHYEGLKGVGIVDYNVCMCACGRDGTLFIFFLSATPLSGGRHRYGCRNGLILIADMLTVLTAFSGVFMVLFGPAVLPVLVPYPINGYGTKEAGGGLAAG